jgi:hypothetical protein
MNQFRNGTVTAALAAAGIFSFRKEVDAAMPKVHIETSEQPSALFTQTLGGFDFLSRQGDVALTQLHTAALTTYDSYGYPSNFDVENFAYGAKPTPFAITFNAKNHTLSVMIDVKGGAVCLESQISNDFYFNGIAISTYSRNILSSTEPVSIKITKFDHKKVGMSLGANDYGGLWWSPDLRQQSFVLEGVATFNGESNNWASLFDICPCLVSSKIQATTLQAPEPSDIVLVLGFGTATIVLAGRRKH